MTFGVFDAAARFEQVRLVNERGGKASILARGKEALEQFRTPVCVDHESVHSHAYQMIERESNERLLKNRDERLRQLVRQWTQARAKTRCQNECLSDFVHEQKSRDSSRLRYSYGAAGDFIHKEYREGDVRFLFQIERPRAEVDDAVVPSQRFCTKQPGDRRRSFQQSIVNESFKVYYAHVLARDIDRPDS